MIRIVHANNLKRNQFLSFLYSTLSIISLLSPTSLKAQQTIGSFTYMNGGFEGQAAGVLGTALSSTNWTRQLQAGASSSIVASGGRSGPTYATITNVAT